MQIIKANFFNSTQVTVALGEREDVQRERRQFGYKGYQSPTSSHLLPLINAICYQTKTTRLLGEDSQSQGPTPNHGDYNECELSEDKQADALRKQSSVGSSTHSCLRAGWGSHGTSSLQCLFINLSIYL